MKKITSFLYKDYPEQPYISPERDLKKWEEFPEDFHYGKVERKQMVRLSENLLPGDIILLWRVFLGTFNTKSIYPQYFEYKYGINGEESLENSINLGYVKKLNAIESLDSLNINIYKRILGKYGLKKSGKKQDLINRIVENIFEENLSLEFDLRKYEITETGKTLVEKYDKIIQKHGPKM